MHARFYESVTGKSCLSPRQKHNPARQGTEGNLRDSPVQRRDAAEVSFATNIKIEACRSRGCRTPSQSKYGHARRHHSPTRHQQRRRGRAETTKITRQEAPPAPKAKGKKEILKAKNIILATGSRPINIPSVPWNGTTVVGSSGALEFNQTPKKLAIIGAGVIGLELGSVWSRLGAHVDIYEAEKSLLPMLDDDISRLIDREFRKQNLNIHLGSFVKGSKKTRKGVSLEIEIDGKVNNVDYEKVIVAVGRRPFTENLLSESVNLSLDEKGFVPVNDYCQTSIDNVYAVGDIVRGPMLAHKAMEEGVMVAERIAGKRMEVNYNLVPSVIYTHPEIAWVGKTEKDLKEENIDYKKGSFPFSASGRALASGDSVGFVKMLADKETDEVLGVQIFGNSASEILQQGLIGMEFSASSEDFGLTMFSHPTVSEALHEAALAVNKQAIHIGN